jgi:hypothetical protein
VYHGVNQATAHSDDEHVTGPDLLRAARVYAASVVEFCGLAPGRRPATGVAHSPLEGERQRGA